MLEPENIITTLIGGSLAAGFIGFCIGCVRFTERGEIEVKQNRKDAQRGATNYMRFKAQLATNSGAIRKGHE